VSADLREVSAEQRQLSGATLWFTGLPSAGKSTIAHAVADRLRGGGERVQVLDGDDVRPYLSADLGYGKQARDTNVARIGWVARLLASHGVVVLVPVIAPYAAARDAVRAAHAEVGLPFSEVFVSTELAIAEERDVKGLYAKARRGEINGLTGIDDPYEEPTGPELTIDTARVDLDTAVELTTALLSSLRDAVTTDESSPLTPGTTAQGSAQTPEGTRP
jgi:adenylylsulfate kinase